MLSTLIFLLTQGLANQFALEQPLATGPSGHYIGKKRVAFYKITVDATTGEPGFFSLKVNGAPSGNVDCPNEAYTMSGTELTMPNYETPGDCAHDQFAAAKLKFISASYDAEKDEVTVKAKWTAVTVTIVGKKVAAEVDTLALPTPVQGNKKCYSACVVACSNSPKGKKVCMAGCLAACKVEETALVPAELARPLAEGPQGHYIGKKRVAFYKITVDARTGEPGFFSLKVTGAPSGNVDCPNEAYTMSGTELTMPNYETEGDCAHDQFAAAKLKFISASYDAAKDEVTVKAKWTAVTVTIVGKKVAEHLSALIQ